MTKLLKDLPVGALVKEANTKHNGQVITWQIAVKNYRGYPGNSVTLILKGPIINRGMNDEGYGQFRYSTLRNWLNNNFYRGFSNDFQKNVLNTNLEFGGIKVFIPSKQEYEDFLRNLRLNNSFWARGGQGANNMSFILNSSSLQKFNNAGYKENVYPMINVSNSVKVKDNPVNGAYEIIWNQPPTKPGGFTLPSKIISRTATTISWSRSTDPENDPISYRLERSLDGGAFVQRYKGSLTSYKDTIEEKGHTSVVYRLTAIDSYGNQSPSLTSASVPVSDNTIPSVETASSDLGKITSAFSVSYKVVDPDEGQNWTVTEKLDGKVLKTFSASVGTSYTCKLSASDWQKILNGKHSITIEVKDSEGGRSSKTISFEKAVTKLDFEMEKSSLEPLDKMPERAILSMGAEIPAGASVKVEITNNGLDTNPTWQDCTSQVLGNEKIFFSNKKKTATQWAVNIRVSGDKKTATEVLSISSIGGFYD
uniref:DUF6273 domain-containing protein n=1 Tax=Anaerococcus mediterraneensis TaxID=1870984 RepID=UPI0009302429|nr:DUF6273 domain-containing protein [Anaerococcus mediterraneensis]